MMTDAVLNDYDVWTEAILMVAKHYRLEASKENLLLTGRWQQNENLSDVLRDLARQVGLGLRTVKLEPKLLTPWRMPLVVQFNDGQVAVMDTIDSHGTVGITYCGDEGVQSSISQDELLANVATAVVLRPSHTVPDARIDDYIKPFEKDWFKKLVLRDMRPYGHVFLASLISNVLALSTILFTRQVYDRVIPAESYSTLYVLFIGVMIAVVFSYIMQKLRTHITDLVGKRADLRISDMVFGHVLRIKNASRPKSTGTFISQVRELDGVRELLTSTTVTAYADLPFFVLFCVVFWFIAGPLVLVPIAAVVFMLLPGFLAQKKLKEYANEALRESSLRNAMLVEAIQGNEDIKVLQAEQRFQNQWNNYNAVSADVNLQLRDLVNRLTIWARSVQMAVFAVIVLFGAPMVIEGTLTTGSLIAASILGSRMISPLAGITQVLNRWQQAKVALKSINSLLELPVDNPESSKKVHLPVVHGAYEIHGAQFYYGEESEVPALRIKELEIKAGEKIALLGRNGAGKSTLLQVLAGLMEPRQGQVLIDGMAMNHIDPADVRRDVGLLSQNSNLFHGTVRENLVMGAPLARDEDILRVLDMTGAMSFIQTLPNGLDYLITEGGLGLSGGQRQALLLARLFLRNPNVLLLDEPTSALDDSTERRLMQQLHQWGSNKTMIIATHKMNLVRLVDRIIVIDNGQIVLDDERDAALAVLQGKGRRQRVRRPAATRQPAVKEDNNEQ